MSLTRSLIVVEGPQDEAFVGRVLRKRLGFELCRFYDQLDRFWATAVPNKFPHQGDLKKRVPVPSFYTKVGVSLAVVSAGSKGQVAAALADHLALLASDPFGVGIFIDADHPAAELAHRSLVADLGTAKVAWPDAAPGVVDASSHRGIFVFPNSRDPGTLDDLILACGANAYAGALDCADRYLIEASAALAPEELKEFGKPAGRVKAKLSTVGAVLGPGKSIQMSIENNRWVDAATPGPDALLQVVDFLKALSTVPPLLE